MPTPRVPTPGEERIALDRLARVARRALGTSVCLISTFEPDRQRFIGADGLTEPWASQRWSPLSHSLCKLPYHDNARIVLPDTRADARSASNGAVTEAGVRAYAGVPMHDRDGRILGAFCAIDFQPRAWTDDDLAQLEDLAMAASAEIALRESLSELQLAQSFSAAIVDTVREPLVVLDHQQRIVSANQALYRFFQVAEHEIIGQPVNPLVDGKPRIPALAAALDQIIARHGAFHALEITEDFDRIGRRTLQVAGQALRWRDATQPLILLAMEDLTDRIAMQRDREAFVDALAHDLRNPLTTIQGQAQLLQRRASRNAIDPDGLDRSAAVIVSEARQMVQLIQTMVETAHLRADENVPIDLAPVDLAMVGESLIAAYRASGTWHTFACEQRATACVLADSVRLRRMLDNLLGNAIKYSPMGGPVTIAVDSLTEPDGTSWGTISVIDQGIGVPPQDLPHLFERFHRGANVGAIAGSGIGLAGVKQLVDQQGGQIAVESTLGLGTTVTIRLPSYVSSTA